MRGLLVATIVVAVGILVANFLSPRGKILVVSSDPKLSQRFALATAQEYNAQVDILCADECTLFRSVSFNCDGEKHVLPCLLHRYNLLKLPMYKHVYIVESVSDGRLERSPFDDAVYKYVIRDFCRDHTAKVTVVFTDVTCEGMREHMRESRTMEKECKESPAGRTQMFNRFSQKVAVTQGNLERNLQYTDYNA